jgi:hypothetical protein
MGRALSNNTSLQVAVETTPGVLPGSPTWFLMEPNEIGKISADIKTVARTPISKNRQRRKGVVTDLDSGAEFTHDLTMHAVDLFMEGFVMSVAKNADCRFQGVNAVSGGYTIPAATAAQAAKFQFNASGPISLVYARGYANTVNNGLRALTSDLAASGTTIPITGSTAETAPTNAEVELCGIRATAGDLALAISGTTGTLSSGNHSVVGAAQLNFTTLGLTVGQFIHIGGLTDTNRFAGAGAVRSYGYARVRTIAAAAITVDKMSSTLIVSDGTANGSGGANVAVDLLFGRFIRNVAVDSAEFLTRTFQIEAAWDNLQNPGPGAEYSYSIGNQCNEMAFNLPLADKATVNFSFVGQDTQNPTTTRKTNAGTPVQPVKIAGMNTSSDILRLRVTEVDESALTTDFKELTITFRNNVTGEKVLGYLGNRYVNNGNFDVEMSGKCVFTDGDVIDAIRGNTTLTADFIVRSEDGAVAVDMPAITLGGGNLELPINESINVDLTGVAFQDTLFGTSVGVSLFAVVPTV